jgi:hypothetical protein
MLPPEDRSVMPSEAVLPETVFPVIVAFAFCTRMPRALPEIVLLDIWGFAPALTLMPVWAFVLMVLLLMVGVEEV